MDGQKHLNTGKFSINWRVWNTVWCLWCAFNRRIISQASFFLRSFLPGRFSTRTFRSILLRRMVCLFAAWRYPFRVCSLCGGRGMPPMAARQREWRKQRPVGSLAVSTAGHLAQLFCCQLALLHACSHGGSTVCHVAQHVDASARRLLEICIRLCSLRVLQGDKSTFGRTISVVNFNTSFNPSR